MYSAVKDELGTNIDTSNESDEQTHVFVDGSNEFSDRLPREDSDGAAKVSSSTGQSQFRNEIIERVTDLGKYMEQLEDLHIKVQTLIKEGDEETAVTLVEANYEALMDQLDQGIEGVEQAAMLDILIQLSMSLQNVEFAQQMLDQMKDILLKSEMHEPLVDILFDHMGTVYLDLGNKEEALFCYTRSIDIQESLLGKSSPLLVNTLFGLAAAYNHLGQKAKAKDVYKQIISIIEIAEGTACGGLVPPLLHLGHLLLEEKNTDEAEVCMQRALKLTKDVKGAGSIGAATCALARVKSAKGDYEEATELYKKGLDIMRKSDYISSEDLVMESMRTEVSEFLNLVGRKKEAQELLEENLREKEKVCGPNSPRLVVHLQNLATSYASDEKFDKCESLIRRSLKLVTTSLGPTAVQVSVPLAFLASTLHHLNKNTEAESMARQALSIREQNFPMDDLLVGEACHILASILHSGGKDDEALNLAWRSLHTKEKHFSNDSLELGGALALIADVLHNLGRTDETMPIIQRLEKLTASYKKRSKR